MGSQSVERGRAGGSDCDRVPRRIRSSYPSASSWKWISRRGKGVSKCAKNAQEHGPRQSG